MKSASVDQRAKHRLPGLFLCIALILSTTVFGGNPAAADNSTISYDTLRTGWDPNEPGLAPSSVSASDFGQLFSTAVDGQVYAQPISAGGTLVVATENNNVYGLNLQTGAVKWSRNVGAAWPSATLGCGDLAPTVGITATPVYDPSSGTLYFTARVNDGPTAAAPHWYMHAVDSATGAERTGWPVVIAGTPANNAGHAFNPETAMQRPGLLLLGGVVYAAFASLCDHQPYVGYLVGVSTRTAAMTTIWATESGSSTAEAGIWQSGGGIVSDGPGQLIFTTGNGVTPAPGPGRTPPTTLAQSVVRVQVGAAGALTATDYFSPSNNASLEIGDRDLGSGGPMAVPDGWGTAAHPHLLVQIGKDGRLFLLDRDNLGGTAQGPGDTDAALSVAGPYHGVWGHPAFWGGADGGYVYTVENGGYLRASKISTDAAGLPILVSAATSTRIFGFTSGSPVVTSAGNSAGSGLVWVENTSGPTGVNGQLLAYNAVPQNGVMHLVRSVPIGTMAKFAVPATDNGRLYVGTRDGHILGFGRPAASPLTAAPLDLGTVPVGTMVTGILRVTATRALTVTGVSTAPPFTAGFPAGSATLAAGASLAVPVTFTPTSAGAASGTVTFATGAGSVAFDLAGEGTTAGLAASPASLDFGTIPTHADKTLSVDIFNTGTTAATVTSVNFPADPFSAASLPDPGTSLPAGGSLAISVRYAPTDEGTNTAALTVNASTGSVTVPLTGTAVEGDPHLVVAPNPLAFGGHLLGTTSTTRFSISNTGSNVLTIAKAAPPVGAFNTTTPIAEGQQIDPGDMMTQAVSFTPAGPGPVSAPYLITGDDGRGPQNELITGIGAVVGNFVGQASSRCMDVAHSGTSNGTPIWLYDCNASAAQYWTSGGTSSLRALGKCLDVVNGAVASGSPVELYDCAGSPSQRWQVGNTGIVRNAASGRCLSPAAAATALTTRLQILDCTASAGQVWMLPHRTGTIVGRTSGGCVDVVGSKALDMTPIQLYDCNASPAQSWTIAFGGTVQALGKCLDLRGAGTVNGTMVQLFTCTGGVGQQWRLQTSGALLNPNSGRCLTPAGNATAVGTQLVIFDCSAVAAQHWVLS